MAPVARGVKATAPRLLFLFTLSLLFPIYFEVLGMRLSPTRVFLLIVVVPMTVQLFSGKAGSIRAIDILLLLYCLWIGITLTVNHGIGRMPLAVISTVELFGGYLVGRILVKNETDFQAYFRYFVYALFFLFPFALIELFTNQNYLQILFKPFFATHLKPGSSYGRMGLERVMGSFEHPILFGLFCSLGFANLFYIHNKKIILASLAAGFVGVMTFTSLSSAPFLVVGTQAALMAWGRVTHERWYLLILLTAVAYITVDLLSNRTPITILINYITFNPFTAWVRINTWQFGSAEVLRHPFFGIGLSSNWVRPDWLTSSVDNFWLLNAMRYGLPGVFFLIAGLASGLWAIIRQKTLSNNARRYRVGYIIALTALYMALSTVHIWGDTSAYMMSYIGAGMWLSNAPKLEEQHIKAPESVEVEKPSRFRRDPIPTPEQPRSARSRWTRL